MCARSCVFPCVPLGLTWTSQTQRCSSILDFTWRSLWGRSQVEDSNWNIHTCVCVCTFPWPHHLPKMFAWPHTPTQRETDTRPVNLCSSIYLFIYFYMKVAHFSLDLWLHCQYSRYSHMPQTARNQGFALWIFQANTCRTTFCLFTRFRGSTMEQCKGHAFS